MYKDLVDSFRACYWNKEIQSKIHVHLEFGKYLQSKGTNEKYLIQLVANAKHLEPEMSEAEFVNKMVHHFSRGIQVAVITQGIKTLEELLLLLRKWESVYGNVESYNTHKPIPVSYTHLDVYKRQIPNNANE